MQSIEKFWGASLGTRVTKTAECYTGGKGIETGLQQVITGYEENVAVTALSFRGDDHSRVGAASEQNAAYHDAHGQATKVRSSEIYWFHFEEVCSAQAANLKGIDQVTGVNLIFSSSEIKKKFVACRASISETLTVISISQIHCSSLAQSTNLKQGGNIFSFDGEDERRGRSLGA